MMKRSPAAVFANCFDYGEHGVPVKDRIFGKGEYLRPNFIQPYRSRNILIEGIHIINSPMWEIHPVLSTNITVRGVKIDSPWTKQRWVQSGIQPRCAHRKLCLRHWR
jgi:polygalacturonase